MALEKVVLRQYPRPGGILNLWSLKTVDLQKKIFQKIACKMGRMFVNGEQMTDINYVFRHNDRVEHWMHRHEHPVSRKQLSYD